MKTQRTRLEAIKTDVAVLPLHLIVLTQNSADYIENYLRHLATQCTQLDAENYTITVIDQNSSDRTLALVELTSRDLTGIHVAYSPADSIQTTLRSIPVQPKSSVVLLSPESPQTTKEHHNSLWETLMQRLITFVQPEKRNDISALAVSADTYQACLEKIQGDTPSQVLGSFYGAVRAHQENCFVYSETRQSSENNPLTTLVSGLASGSTVPRMRQSVLTHHHAAV